MLVRMLALPLGHQLPRNGQSLLVAHLLAGLDAFEFDAGRAVA